MIRARIDIQRGGRTHEEDREEQVALRVAPGLAWVVSFLDAVNRADDHRKDHGQHHDSQGPPASEANEAETLAAPKGSEEQSPHVHNRPYGIYYRVEGGRVLERQHVT